MVMVAGFVQSRADLDIAALISKTYTELTGKEDVEPFVHITQTEKEGFDRSSWIHNDMGVAYGFATRETPEGLPFPLVVAQQVKRHTADARLIDPACQFLGYDGEIVVTTEGKRVTSLQLELEHPSTMNPSDVQQANFNAAFASVACDACGSAWARHGAFRIFIYAGCVWCFNVDDDVWRTFA